MQSPSPPLPQAPVHPNLAKSRPPRMFVTVPLLRPLLACCLLAALPAAAATPAPPSDDCDCGASAEEQLGKPIVGTVQSLPEAVGRIVVTHKSVPGLLRPGETEFLINATVRAVLRPGDRLLAQAVPLDDGTWELRAVRRLKPVAATPSTATSPAETLATPTPTPAATPAASATPNGLPSGTARGTPPAP